MTDVSRLKKWRKANPEKLKEARKRYYEKNKEKIAARKRELRKLGAKPRIKVTDEDKRIRKKEYTKKYRKTDAYRAERNRRYQRIKNNPEFKLKKALRRRLEKALKGKGAKVAMVQVGCSFEELKRHLEAQFEAGMSWGNYGEWHVDHIRPICSFDLSDPQQQAEANHYTNLQPLWAEDNSKKALADVKRKIVTDQV